MSPPARRCRDAASASAWLSAIGQSEVSLKLEAVQPGGSFKIRGALNALLAARHRASILDTERLSRIVTGPAGNHGRGVVMAARRVGARAIVFTPSSAPEAKKAAIRELGGELRDHRPDYDAAEREALIFVRVEGIPFVSPYIDRDVIAGAGTVGLEIVEQLPHVRTSA